MQSQHLAKSHFPFAKIQKLGKEKGFLRIISQKFQRKSLISAFHKTVCCTMFFYLYFFKNDLIFTSLRIMAIDPNIGNNIRTKYGNIPDFFLYKIPIEIT